MFLESIFFQLFLAFISIIANMLAAFAGGGAGLVQLPVLIFLGLPFSTALATHKLASVSLGLGATLRHSQEKSLNRRVSLLVLCSGLPGVFFGAKFVLSIPDHFASILLGALTLLLAIYSIRQSRFGLEEKDTKFTKRKYFVGSFVLFLIGFLNGSLSSGTGLFVTLWLVSWFGLTYTNAIAHTLILVGLFWNGTGALVLGFSSPIKWSWIPMLIVGSSFGGYIGAHFSLLKGNKLVKTMFEVISFLIGISLLLRSLSFGN